MTEPTPDWVEGLPPVVGPRPRLLVLGSIPGRASLAASRYYGHPRNAFWPIAAHWLGFDPELDYEDRLRELERAGIALWDVVGRCRRHASSDASIRDPEANDIVGLIESNPTVSTVLLNGTTAARTFEALVRKPRAELFEERSIHALPSTSPANASWSFAKKLDAWRLLWPS